MLLVIWSPNVPPSKMCLFFFPLKYLHKVSDSTNYLKSVQYKNNVHKIMNCIHTNQGIDKAICHNPGLNIGSNKSLWWVMELRNPFGETCENLRMEDSNPVVTHLRTYEPVATVTNASCPGTITPHEWLLSCEHSHCLGAVAFYHHPSPKPWSQSKCFSQPHRTHPKMKHRKFISFPYSFVLLLNRSLEMAQLAPA